MNEFLNKTLFLNDKIANLQFDSYQEGQEFEDLIEKRFLEESSKIKKTAKKVDNLGDKAIMVVKEIKKDIKGIYSTDEKHLKTNTPQLSKLISRAVITITLYHIPVVGPMCAVIHFFTGLALKSKNDAKSREKLENMYKSKLEFIDEKINRTDDDKEKYQLIKLKNQLKTSITKLNYLDNH